MSELHKAQANDALIKMANEIARNIAPGQSPEQAATLMAEHLVRFWAISMKLQIIKCLDTEKEQLDSTATEAIKALKEMYS